MKSDIDRYRANAERYLIMAATARNPLVAKGYQELAEIWLRMTADAAELEQARQFSTQSTANFKTGH
jgi:hypothetical protein